MKIRHKSPENYFFGERLMHLMELDGLYKFRTPHKELAERLLGNHIEITDTEYNGESDKTPQQSQIDNISRAILRHLRYRSADRVDSKYIIAYCDYFGCESDYLLGYIDHPTKELADLIELTGLSEKALIRLKNLCEQSKAIIPDDAPANKTRDKILNANARSNIECINLILEKGLNELNMSLFSLILRYVKSNDNPQFIFNSRAAEYDSHGEIKSYPLRTDQVDEYITIESDDNAQTFGFSLDDAYTTIFKDILLREIDKLKQ